MSTTTDTNPKQITKLRGRRRGHTVIEKLAFLDAAKQPGESIASIGRRFGISASLLFRWKRELTPSLTGEVAPSALGRVRARLAELELQLEETSAQNLALRAAIEQLNSGAVSLPSLAREANRSTVGG